MHCPPDINYYMKEMGQRLIVRWAVPTNAIANKEIGLVHCPPYIKYYMKGRWGDGAEINCRVGSA
ncbi:hypothetical protein BJP36_36605 [Moorena producens JHB]|uniref:Uncharacterized protein n=1 Tax=Moorena producens (strain JHB) TaxID=1454205 RepID=A0A9Q9UW91_MOOP1|nr:hypothetical protein [Moorena producens]WAN69618.1 hypothetical protein BJP36_36605 [Moorena producens JHB]